MSGYATFENVQTAAYGIDLPEEVRSSVEALIAKAEERLLARVPSIPARVSSGALSEELVRGVVEDIVLRVVRNPNGYSSEQAGEFSYRIDRASASGRIEIRPEDIAALLPAARSRAVGSVRAGAPSWRLP